MEKNRNLYFTGLSIFTGTVLWMAWPPKHYVFLIFFAFIPLLYIEQDFYRKKIYRSELKLFLFSFLTFLIWNALTTYWLYNATLEGAFMAIFINSLLMSLPLLLFHKVKRYLKKEISLIYFICFWLSYELLHLSWDFSWPWLHLGNAFAVKPEWIQWYEYTGILGGTFWILLVNISVFYLLKRLNKSIKRIVKDSTFYLRFILVAFVVIVPIIISNLIKVETLEQSPKNVVIVQPNVDPYSEKFASGTYQEQIENLLNLSRKNIDSNTVLLVWPETAISRPVDENQLKSNNSMILISRLLKQYPNIKLIAGMDSYRFFKKGEELSPTARFYKSDSTYYDSYNSALMLDHNLNYEIYHKSRLVPGVEQMPYPKTFKFLEKLIIDLGGTSGSLGRQKEASIFEINDDIKVAPIICYESVYGDYLGDFVMKGANIITIITNDGWWGDTPGYKQHYLYSVLRAIEMRRNVIRSANTGVSCYVNSKGEIIQKTNWWERATIKQNISLNNKITFYANAGDYIGRIASLISILILLVAIVRRFSRKSLI